MISIRAMLTKRELVANPWSIGKERL
jgi:hypothetical protein